MCQLGSYLNKVNGHKGVNGMNGTGKLVNTSKKGQHTYIHTYVNVLIQEIYINNVVIVHVGCAQQPYWLLQL